MAEEAMIRMKEDQNPVLPIFDPKDFHSKKARRSPAQEADQVNVYSLRETERLNRGIEDIFGTLYSQLEFETLLGSSPKEVKWNYILKKCNSHCTTLE